MRELLEIFWLGLLGVLDAILCIASAVALSLGILWLVVKFPITMTLLMTGLAVFWLIMLVGVLIKIHKEE